MKHASELTNILNQNFMWRKPRIDCYVNILLAIILSKTVNLAQLPCFISSKAKQDSRYRRLQRFFECFKIELTIVSRFVYQLFGFDKVSQFRFIFCLEHGDRKLPCLVGVTIESKYRKHSP